LWSSVVVPSAGGKLVFCASPRAVAGNVSSLVWLRGSSPIQIRLRWYLERMSFFSKAATTRTDIFIMIARRELRQSQCSVKKLFRNHSKSNDL
jgi:hypothetical protein